MQQPASADRLDPALKRDLFFGDVASTRREIMVAGVALLVINCVYAARTLFVPETSGQLLSVLSTAVIFAALALGGLVRRPADVLTAADSTPASRRGLNALDDMLAHAERDPDLAADQRMAGAIASARQVRLVSRSLAAGIIVLALTSVLVAVRRSPSPVEGLFRPTPPSAVELVDVLLMPSSPDFHGLISVDVTRGQVTKIAPYVTTRSGRAPEVRAFEAIGRYLVAGDAIDLAQPDWLTRFKASWMRRIDIGTTADFLVVDADPRTHDIARDQIAAAVVGGKYYSRKDLQATRR
jgi:hypothetical protein